MIEPEVSFPIEKTPAKKTKKRRRKPIAENGLATWKRTQRWVHDRAKDRCEAAIPDVCVHRSAHVHHVVLRSRGGSDDPSNLLAVCFPCHDYIHAHPAWATEQGFMRRAS